MKKKIALGVAAAMLLTACSSSGSSDNPSTGTSNAPAGDEIVIAWISPDATTSVRWDTQDRPAFEAAVKEIAPNAKILATTADSDQAMIQQAEAALTQGADVIVVNPITSEGAIPIVDMAKREDVPVISYEGLISGAEVDGYITFDNLKVGEIQAQYIVDNAGPDATIAVMNGAQVCEACIAFKVGAHNIFDPLVASGNLTIGYEADTPDWLTANAQTQTEQALTKLNDNVQGILAANDGLAQGVIAALKARQLNGEVIVTGQDATLAGLQEILAGNQTMTVYKNILVQAKAAAVAAVALATGEGDSGLIHNFDNNGVVIPALFLDPVAVDITNIGQVVSDGLYTRDELCTPELEAACDF